VTDHDRAFLQPRVFIPFILVTLIWGSTWLVITGQLGSVPPAWSVTYRFSIGAILMFGFAAMTRAGVRIDRQGHRLAFVFGILQFGANFNFVYLAEQHVTSGLVAVVYALLLVPNSLLAALFLKHRVSPRFLAGSAVGVAGVALLFLHEVRFSPAGSSEAATGIALALLGLLSVSVSNVIQGAERMRAYPAAAMIAWAMFYGVLFDLLLSASIYGPPTFEPTFVYVAGLLYLGLFASAIAFTLYLAIIRAVGPGRAAYSSLIIPILAMALSTMFEDYIWSPLAVVGALLALAGLFIALKARKAEAASD
jgi:drug/metabolite transporter (DMT)-like permease